jgi:hypothetical protein
MPLQYFEEKIIFLLQYLFILLSQYLFIAILCAKMSRVNKRFPAGVNFATNLHEAFMQADTKSAKMQSSHQSFFALLGSECKKLCLKCLLKSTPGGSHPSFESLTLLSSQMVVLK